MRLLSLIAFSLFAASAHACETYTSELWEPGVRTAQYTGDKLVIVDKAWGKTDTYDVSSVGTGIPYRFARNVKKADEVKVVREYRGDLLIDMEAFTCH